MENNDLIIIRAKYFRTVFQHLLRRNTNTGNDSVRVAYLGKKGRKKQVQKQF